MIDLIEVWRDGNEVVGRVSIKKPDGLCQWEESCYIHPLIWDAMQEDVIPYLWKFILVGRYEK